MSILRGRGGLECIRQRAQNASPSVFGVSKDSFYVVGVTQNASRTVFGDSKYSFYAVGVGQNASRTVFGDSKYSVYTAGMAQNASRIVFGLSLDPFAGVQKNNSGQAQLFSEFLFEVNTKSNDFFQFCEGWYFRRVLGVPRRFQIFFLSDSGGLGCILQYFRDFESSFYMIGVAQNASWTVL